eukprot:scpid62951/ scgid15204/ 
MEPCHATYYSQLENGDVLVGAGESLQLTAYPLGNFQYIPLDGEPDGPIDVRCPASLCDELFLTNEDPMWSVPPSNSRCSVRQEGSVNPAYITTTNTVPAAWCSTKGDTSEDLDESWYWPHAVGFCGLDGTRTLPCTPEISQILERDDGSWEHQGYGSSGAAQQVWASDSAIEADICHLGEEDVTSLSKSPLVVPCAHSGCMKNVHSTLCAPTAGNTRTASVPVDQYQPTATYSIEQILTPEPLAMDGARQGESMGSSAASHYSYLEGGDGSGMDITQPAFPPGNPTTRSVPTNANHNASGDGKGKTAIGRGDPARLFIQNRRLVEQLQQKDVAGCADGAACNTAAACWDSSSASHTRTLGIHNRKQQEEEWMRMGTRSVLSGEEEGMDSSA